MIWLEINHIIHWAGRDPQRSSPTPGPTQDHCSNHTCLIALLHPANLLPCWYKRGESQKKKIGLIQLLRHRHAVYNFQQTWCLRHLLIQVYQDLEEPHVWSSFWRPELKANKTASESVVFLQIQDMLRRNIRINACPPNRIALSTTAMIILNMQQMSSKKK